MSPPDFLRELARDIRAEGLDAHPTEGDAALLVGTKHRGDRSAPAVVRIREADATEYLAELAADRDGDDADRYAFGMLVMLLVEVLSTVHDGENNMVTEVELRRGLEGRLGLHETRIESGAPLPPPGDTYGWTADRG